MSKTNGVDMLLQLGVDVNESDKLLNSWAEKMSTMLEEAFKIKMSPEEVRKTLRNVEVEFDSVTKKIKKMITSMGLSSGRTITSEFNVDGGEVSGFGSVKQIANITKESSSYLKVLDAILKKRKEIDKIEIFEEKGRDADLAKLKKQVEILDRIRLYKLGLLQSAGTDEAFQTIEKGNSRVDDYYITRNAMAQRKIRQDEAISLKEQNKLLQEYETREKRILKNKQTLWRLQEEFESNRFKQSKATELAMEKTQKLIDKDIALNKQLRNSQKDISPDTYKKMNDLRKEYNTLGEQQHELVKAQYAQNKNFFRDLMAGWRDAAARIINYTIIYRSLWTVIKGFQAGVQIVENLNKQFTDIQMVTGATNEEIRKMSSSYNELAGQLGVTTSIVTEGATEWLRQGKTIRDTTELIKQSMILSKTGAMSAAEATQYLTSTMNGYKLSVEDASRVVDVFSKLDMSAATSSKELAIAFSRTANSANDMGVEFEELAAWITTVSETTRRSASTVGEAFKTIFARMANVKLGVAVDPETGEAINDVEKALASLDIRLRESPTKWREAQDVLMEIGKNWETYNDQQKNTIVTALAGVRQAEVLRAAFNNFNDVLKYTEEAYNSTGSSAEKYGVYLDSIEAKQNELKNTLMEIAYQKQFEDFYKILLDVANILVKVIGTAVTSPVAFGVMSVALLSIVNPKIVKGVNTIVEALNSIGDRVALAGGAKNAVVISKLGNSIEKTTNSLGNFTDAEKRAIVKNKEFIASQWKAIDASNFSEKAKIREKASIIEATLAKDEEAAASWQSNYANRQEAVAKLVNANATKVLSVSIATLWANTKYLFATMATNPLVIVGVALTALTFIKQLYDKWNVTLEEHQEILGELRSEYDESIGKIDELKSKLEEVQAKLKELESGSINIVKQAEIDKLKEAKKELENQLKIEEAISKIKAEKMQQEALVTINLKSETALSPERGEKGEAFGATFGVKSGGVKYSLTRYEAVEERIGLYNKLLEETKTLEEEVANSTKLVGDALVFKKRKIDDNKEKLREYAIYIGENVEALMDEKTALNENTEEGRKAIKVIDDTIDMFMAWRDAIDGVNTTLTDTNTVLTYQEQLDKDFRDGKMSLADYSLEMKKINAGTQEYTNKIRDLSIAQKYLAGVIEKVNNAESLSLEEKNELLRIFPDLRDSIEETADGFTIEQKALNLLNESLGSISIAYGDLKTSQQTFNSIMTSDLAKNVRNRLELLQTEFEGIDSLSKAYTVLAQSYFGGNTQRTKEWVNEYEYWMSKGVKMSDESNAMYQAIIRGRSQDKISKLLENVKIDLGSIPKIGGSKSSSSSSAIDSPDMTKAFLLGANAEVENLKHLIKLTEEKIKREDDASEKIKLQNELLSLQHQSVTHLQLANTKISKKINEIKSKYGELGKESEKWFDSNGQATELYFQTLDKFTGKTDSASKNAKKRIEDLYGELYTLKNGFIENTQAISAMEDAIESTKQTMSDALTSLYNEQKKAIDDLVKLTVDLIKQQKKEEKDALEERLDKFKETIDARKKELELTKGLVSYNKDLAQKQKEVAKTEQKLLELQFDDSARGKAMRLKLEEELMNQKSDLEELQRDRSYDLQEEALDNELKLFEKKIDKQKKVIDDYLNKTGTVTADAMALINKKSDILYDNLMDWNMKYGDGLRDTVVNGWNEAYKALEYYKDALNGLDVVGSLGKIDSGLKNPSVSVDKALIQSIKTRMMANSNAWAEANKIGDEQRKKQLHEDNIKLASQIGAKYNSSEGRWYLDGVPLYHTGGIVGGSGLKTTEEFAKLLKGEVIATESQISNFMKYVLPNLISSPQAMSYQTNNNSIGDINLSFNIAGNLDKTVVPDIKKISEDAINKINISMRNRGITRTSKRFSF